MIRLTTSDGALRLPPRHGLCQSTLFPSVLAGSHFAMKQKSRVPKPRRPTLAHMVSDLVKLLEAMKDLEDLREKVRLAEAKPARP
ncbi:hypothetical protein [Bradyrhizobium liaoningense]|uniref:hypothetical protein n=1 Tax=Bradyrhizobium liaoningense TaxID=43992 RepID=UPI001BABDE81|nr:hypothetical protein [Bradyrhizobium liaoningense]